MKIKLFIILLCIFNCASVLGQTNCDCFDRLNELASYYSEKGNLALCFQCTKDAITYLEPSLRPEYYSQLGWMYSSDSTKNLDSAKKYFTLAITKGGYDINEIKKEIPDIYGALDTLYIKKELNLNKEKIDLELYGKLCSVLAVDQSIRNERIFPENEMFNSEDTSCIRKVITNTYLRVDSITFEFLKWYLETYKFPSYQQLGYLPNGFIAMIMHVTAYKNENWNNYIFNKLKELNLTCNYVQKSQILFFMNRNRLFNKMPSITGITTRSNRYTNIEAINKADSIRFEYNLLRIKEESIHFPNCEIPKDYKPRPYPKNYFCLKKYNIE